LVSAPPPGGRDAGHKVIHLLGNGHCRNAEKIDRESVSAAAATISPFAAATIATLPIKKT
jgi:hypothetical protein